MHTTLHTNPQLTSDAGSSPAGGLRQALPATRWIALLGISASSRNQGVQALGAALVELCLRDVPGMGIRLLTCHTEPAVLRYRVAGCVHDVPVVNCRLAPGARMREHLAWIVAAALIYRMVPHRGLRGLLARRTPWIAALQQADFAADIRGGDSFSDLYGMKRFVTGFLAAWSVLLVKGSIVQLPQTYGPFKSPVARWMARYLLRRSSLIMARDTASQRVAQQLAGPAREVRLSPDVAFALEARRPATVVLEPPHDGAVPLGSIGLNVNGLMYQGGYTRSNMFGLRLDYRGFLRRLVLALLDEQARDIWLVPHTYAPPGDVESDPEACRLVRDALPAECRHRVRIVAAEYDPHELKGVIGMCGFFVGSRMHSCIAALSQGVPCVGVAYSMKFKGVFESVGMEQWVVDGREVESDAAVRQVLRHYQNRASVRESLQQHADGARHNLAATFQGMMDLLGGTAGGSPPAVALKQAMVH